MGVYSLVSLRIQIAFKRINFEIQRVAKECKKVIETIEFTR